MARPIKQGLDYFPMDVETDDKFELIEARHGITGFGVLVKLFQRIYKEGYYLQLSEELILIFSKRINVDINKVNEVINDCIKYNIFTEELYKKYNILTSCGIQKRFLTAIGRRKDVEMIKQFINVDNNLINVNINVINYNISTQRKGKERKGKESKEAGDFIDNIISLFQECYFETNQIDYIITNKEKERSCAGKLLGIYKKKHPDLDTEQTLDGFRKYFEMVMQIKDDWIQKNMSIPIILSKFNDINKILKNGTTKQKQGITNQELAGLLARKLATDRPV